jgi:hypothetical protein
MGFFKRLLDWFGSAIGWLKFLLVYWPDIEDALSQLANLPDDWDDPTKVRPWLQESTKLLKALAAMTATPWDDRTLGFIDSILANDDTWNQLWDLVTARQRVGAPLAAGDDRAEALGAKVGISPALIWALVDLIVSVIQWFRNRNQAIGAPAP